MQATFSYESDFFQLYDSKDVIAWYKLQRFTKSLQQEMCEEIDREIIENLRREVQLTCAPPSVSSSSSYKSYHTGCANHLSKFCHTFEPRKIRVP